MRAAEPAGLAAGCSSLVELEGAIPGCSACPRLRAYCSAVADEKVKRFSGEVYWGRPVPGFGDAGARVLIAGLAPAAHGANRTGRMFTGDRSGDFLYAGLHRAGLCNQPTSVARGDGLRLSGVYIGASARCAPPQNRPLPEELAACRAYLRREIELLTELRVLLVLGGIAHEAVLRALPDEALPQPRPRIRFAHGAEHRLLPALGRQELVLLDCYHVSQQNTFTGLLTPAMLDQVLARARALAGL